MDLTVIRIKRAREVEPVEQIGLSLKKLKSAEGVPVITKVATLHSKDECLDKVVKEAVLKIKRNKGLKLYQSKEGFSDLYKNTSELQRRANFVRDKAARQQKEDASSSRYQIISKARGLTGLDSDTLNYLAKCDSFSLQLSEEFPKSPPASDEAQTSSEEDKCQAQAVESKMELEVIDVQDSAVPDDDDIICVNGKPMEKIATQYEYDVYIATAPKNCFDDIDIIEPSPLYYNYDACDADEDRDSEDSNDENHHQNEYPDGEESDFDDGPDYGEDSEYYDSDDSFRASYSDDGLDGLANQLGGINLSKELRRIAGYPFSAERNEECSSDSDSS